MIDLLVALVQPLAMIVLYGSGVMGTSGLNA